MTKFRPTNPENVIITDEDDAVVQAGDNVSKSDEVTEGRSPKFDRKVSNQNSQQKNQEPPINLDFDNVIKRRRIGKLCLMVMVSFVHLITTT